MKRHYRHPDRIIDGMILKVGNQYVCWNSYKAIFFLGKKKLSEIFPMRSILHMFGYQSKFTNLALSCFPSAKIVDVIAK